MSLDNKRVNTKSDSYSAAEQGILDALINSSVPTDEQLENLHLFITPQQMRRIFFIYEIYKEILEVPGIIMQFGVRWGRELALLESLRTTFEPFNHSRRIVGFDTFSGYAGINAKDGGNEVIREGNLTTTAGYEEELTSLLDHREQLSPVPNVRKYELVKGDASTTLETYLKNHPATIVSLAHLDMNLYEPTKKCLELLIPHLTKGSVLIVDEINLDIFPGETIALSEVFGLNNIRLKRHPLVNPTWPAYLVID